MTHRVTIILLLMLMLVLRLLLERLGIGGRQGGGLVRLLVRHPASRADGGRLRSQRACNEQSLQVGG